MAKKYKCYIQKTEFATPLFSKNERMAREEYIDFIKNLAKEEMDNYFRIICDRTR